MDIAKKTDNKYAKQKQGLSLGDFYYLFHISYSS